MLPNARSLSITILGLNYFPERSGIAPYTTGLAAGLADRGHRVQVITAFPHYPEWRVHDGYRSLGQVKRLDGVDVSRVRHYVPRRPTLPARSLSEVTFGCRLLTSRWRDPDVVLCVSPALISSAMALARVKWGRGRPASGLIVQDIYSAGLQETRAVGRGVSKSMTRFESRAVKLADGVAVIHDRFKSRIESELGLAPDRVTVIRNWSHVNKSHPFDREGFRMAMGWRPGEIVVLHAGAMGEKQGLHNVVDAARLAEAQGRHMRFVLIGDGSQRETLEARARGCTLVDFVDPLPGDAYARAMESADVLLVNERPDLVEMAVPSKLTSYFSTGVPVLAATGASSTTAHELAASGAGIRVEPGEPEELVTGALRLGEDRELALTIGAKGPAYCESMLSEHVALDAFNSWVLDLEAKKRKQMGVA